MQNFSIGFSGLDVAQRAIDLIATNIANVGTEGYHRQELITRPVNFNLLGRVPIGGVEVGQIRRRIDTFLFKDNFPVDIRHNAKIHREKLAVWSSGQLP